MSMFGWCQTGDHEHCRRKAQKFYIGPVGQGRQRRDAVIFLDEWNYCDCKLKTCKCYKQEREET